MAMLMHRSCRQCRCRRASNVFMTFAVLYVGQGLEMDFVYSGLCLPGAVYFIFRA